MTKAPKPAPAKPAAKTAPKAAPAAAREAIVILGMHRSGTSGLTRALGALGWSLPADPMPAQPDNPEGFFEPLSVVWLNNALLKELGGTWDAPGPFLIAGEGLASSETTLNASLRARYLDRAVEALRTSFGDARRLVFKDPRALLFLPLWLEAMAREGIQPRFLLIHRNPLEVAASIRERNKLPLRRGFQLWQRYTDAALAVLGGAPVAVLAYEDLVEDPAAALSGALTALGHAPAPADLSNAAAVIAPKARHQRHDAAALDAHPLVAPLIRETWALLRGWNATAPEARAEAVRSLHARFEDAAMFAGPLITVPRAVLTQAPAPAVRPRPAAAPAPALAQPAAQPAAPPAPEPKPATAPNPAPAPAPTPTSRAVAADASAPLVLHYHLFKNAGTSVDDMLTANFGDRWGHAEFRTPAHRPTNVDEVEAWLKDHPGLDAFSSHTALLPVPAVDGRPVFPIIFVRHPIDRLKSAYSFERKQSADTHGSRLAKSTDLAGYVTALVKHPVQRQARNFQTHRLACNLPADQGSERERALKALDALPFVGLVEAYDASVSRLETLLKPHYPAFRAVSVQKNVTRERSSTLDERLAAIEAEIGKDLYQTVVAANADDILIHERVSALYA